MSDSFTFYRSFYEAIDQLGEKAQLKLYKNVMKLCLNRCKNVPELEQLCDEIETDLSQNRNVFAQFLLMKPHLMKSAKAGLAGVQGGAPEGNKNAEKTSNNNIEDKEEDKDKDKKENKGSVVFFENLNSSSLKNPDLIFDPQVNKALEVYEKECGNLIPLGYAKRDLKKRQKIKEFLSVISGNFAYFEELCRKANTLKTIASHKIDIDSLMNNYMGIMGDKYTVEANPPPVADAKTRAREAEERLRRKQEENGND